MAKEYIERETACEKMPDDVYGFRDKKILKAIPAADVVEVRHGRWLVIDGCSYCSSCRNNYKRAIMSHANYCPNCGAKMDGGVNDGKAD